MSIVVLPFTILSILVLDLDVRVDSCWFVFIIGVGSSLEDDLINLSWFDEINLDPVVFLSFHIFLTDVSSSGAVKTCVVPHLIIRIVADIIILFDRVETEYSRYRFPI